MTLSRSSLKAFALVTAGLIAAAGCEKGGGGASEAKLAELEKRLKTLEDSKTSSEGAMAFLDKVYQQNRKQMEEEEGRTHAPDATWAVDITGNQINGPASGAYVTIIEAWDFA